MFNKRIIRWGSLAFWGIAVLLFWSVMNAQDLTVLHAIEYLVAWIRQSPWGSIGYVLFYVVQPLFFFPSTLLTVEAGYLFGPFWGIVLTLVGSNLSSVLAHTMGRFVGASFVSDERMNRLIRRFAPRLESRPFETVLIMRLLYLPYDLTSYSLGALRVPLMPFIFGTAIGALPGTISFVLFGASIEGDFSGQLPNLNPTNLLWAAGLFVASITVSRLIRRWDRDFNDRSPDKPSTPPEFPQIG